MLSGTVAMLLGALAIALRGPWSRRRVDMEESRVHSLCFRMAGTVAQRQRAYSFALLCFGTVYVIIGAAWVGRA